jgi:hypothetical protein
MLPPPEIFYIQTLYGVKIAQSGANAVPDTFYFPTFQFCSGTGMIPSILPEG